MAPSPESRWDLRRVFRLPASRARAQREVDDELRFHIDEQIEEQIARGAAPDQARADVLRRFGNVAAVRSTCIEISERHTRRSATREMFRGIAQDAVFAARTLRRRPLFAATMLLTLSLGIGATASMFSVVNGVLLADLPYRDPGQLVTIYTTFPQWRGKPILGDVWSTLSTPYPDYINLVDHQRSFAGVAGYQLSDAALQVGDGTARVTVGDATSNLLSVLGVAVESGRWFARGEDGPSAQRLAVLSYELWQSRFGGAPVLDSVVTVDEEPYRIIGVLPRGFALAGKDIAAKTVKRPEIWIPFGVHSYMLQPNNQKMELVARLRPGVTLGAAAAEVEPLLRGDRPAGSRSSRLVARAEAETSDVRRPLLVLFAAVGLLLLITCGNVAMLFLSECVVRDHELRTRALLGAGRLRLMRLLLTESAVIAIAGAAAGSVFAWWGTRAMLHLAPRELPHASMVHLDVRVCLFTAGVAVAVALVAGAIPALTLTRDAPMRSAVQSRIATGRSRLQTTVIALQAAMSIVLMSGAALLGRSLLNERRTDPGFRARNILAMRVDLPRSLDRTGPLRRSRYDLIAERLAAIPRVDAATAISNVPLAGRTNAQSISLRPDGKLSNGSVSAERAVIFPNYLDVMRIPLRAGRAFTALDTDTAHKVSIVSEGFVKQFWPGERVVGRQFRSPQGVLTIVGVAADVRNVALDRAPEALYYLPAAQEGTRLSFLVSTRGDPLALASAVQRAVWDAAPGSTVSEVTSLGALIDRALAPARYRALLSTLFAGMALLLTTVGVAGLIARSVASRLRELCIRMAVGASPRRAVTLAVRRGVSAVLAGIGLGLAVMPVTSRWLADYVYEVGAGDPATLLVTISLTLVACLGATLVATRRLRRVDLAGQLRET